MTNNIIETIKGRKSHFPATYTQENIPLKDVHTILESARWAPTHKKTEPWRYKVIQSEGLKDLGDFMQQQFKDSTGNEPNIKVRKLAEKMTQASAVILIFMHRDERESVPEWEEIAAVSMSVQNMWLTASNLGYGAYWSSPKAFADMSQFNRITVDAADRFLGFFYLGTISKDDLTDDRQRKEIADFTEFVG
jgi:nitroreductase